MPRVAAVRRRPCPGRRYTGPIRADEQSGQLADHHLGRNRRPGPHARLSPPAQSRAPTLRSYWSSARAFVTTPLPLRRPGGHEIAASASSAGSREAEVRPAGPALPTWLRLRECSSVGDTAPGRQTTSGGPMTMLTYRPAEVENEVVWLPLPSVGPDPPVPTCLPYAFTS